MKPDNNKTDSHQRGVLTKKILAEYLGVSEDDIHFDDSFREDLHMNSSDLSDFLSHLSNKGIPVDQIDLTTIETLEELIEELSQDEL